MLRRIDGLFDLGYAPHDGNVAEGHVAVYDTSAPEGALYGVVLPNHPSAVDGGRAFAGIIADTGYTGTPLLQVGQSGGPVMDRGVKLQKFGWAKCRAKPATTFAVGEAVGYLPSDGGVVIPAKLSPQTIVIGICQENYTSPATGGGYVTVELSMGATSPGTSGLLGMSLLDSAPLTGNVEAAFVAVAPNPPPAVLVPAGLLRGGSELHVSAKCRITGVNAGDKFIGRLRLGGLLGLKLAETPTAGGGTAVAVGDVVTFDALLRVRSIGKAAHVTVQAKAAIGTNGVAPLLVASPGGILTMDTTVDNLIVGTGVWNSADPKNLVILEDISAILYR